MLKCENVKKNFGSLVAVNNVSFEVGKGEVMGIAGPNGSGKTTLFNLITGIYSPQGKILLNDKKINGLPPYSICHCGIARTFQIPKLFKNLSVYDNIRVGAHFGRNRKSGEENQIIERMIEFVDLAGREHEFVEGLKLLDKKRLMIAIALATEPNILLLDEPIAGLNPTEILEAVKMFKKINQELGLAIIIIEHFMKVLIELSEKLMILENGQMIAFDAPEKVIKDKKVIECYLGKNYA
jgi:branched-chain amino acid transport system ATP-binding protein